jgi:hypothetical protein
MKRIALVVAVIALAACTKKDEAPAVDTAAMAPAPAVDTTMPMMDSASMMDTTMKADTTKK